MQFGGKCEEHALSVGFGGEELFALEDAEGGRRAIAVNAGLVVDVHGGDGFVVEGSPLAAGEFDFG